jgi:hypothetical protein
VAINGFDLLAALGLMPMPSRRALEERWQKMAWLMVVSRDLANTNGDLIEFTGT